MRPSRLWAPWKRGPRALLLAAFAVSAASAVEAGESSLRGALTEARWTAPGADLFEFLAASPGECLKAPAGGGEGYLVEAGRAAFRSPLLFGGPAARAGLSCNSCHRDGRGNPDFFLAGVSDGPGTADVTSSLMSKVREDGIANPVAIPTLVGAGSKSSFGTMAPQPTLEAFIHGAVEDEFQGAPPASIVKAIAAYVAHLDAGACPEEAAPQTVRAAMADVDRALGAAEGALARDDGAAADFLLLAAQNALSPIHERYSDLRLWRERDGLEQLARDIGAIRPLLEAAPREVSRRLAATRAAAGELATRLHKMRRRSLYDLKVLRRAVEEGG